MWCNRATLHPHLVDAQQQQQQQVQGPAVDLDLPQGLHAPSTTLGVIDLDGPLSMERWVVQDRSHSATIAIGFRPRRSIAYMFCRIVYASIYDQRWCHDGRRGHGRGRHSVAMGEGAPRCSLPFGIHSAKTTYQTQQSQRTAFLPSRNIGFFETQTHKLLSNAIIFLSDKQKKTIMMLLIEWLGQRWQATNSGVVTQQQLSE
jgi:hypothetical protein